MLSTGLHFASESTHRRTRSQKQLPHWQTLRNKLIGRIRGAIAT
jgi:hypothetical protein